MADILWEGFDDYGIVGQALSLGGTTTTAGDNILGYWTTMAGTFPIYLVAGRFTGCAVAFNGTGTGGTAYSLSKTLANSYGTIIFGIAFKSTLLNVCGLQFQSGSTAQVSVSINSSGLIEVRRGTLGGTLLATSIQSVTSGTWHYLEGKIKFNNGAGTVDISLDGSPTSISLTSQNTDPAATAITNVLNLVSANQSGQIFTFDDLYLFDTTGGTNNAMVGDVRIETLFGNADSAVQFAFGSAVLGAAYDGGYTGNSFLSNAPGANELVLRKFVTGPAGTLQDVRLLPAATSASAKFKAVLYNDNGLGTAPTGAVVATGTEVIGCTNNVELTLPFASGQALSASTAYWIGNITDTSVALFTSDVNTLGYKAANTYGSGAPTSPTMTSGQSSWMIWGNLTGTGVNWWEVDQQCPVGDLSYVFDSTVGHEDLFATAGLSSTPTTIYGAKVKAMMKKTDAGPRTISLRIKSGGSDSGGSLTGQNLTASYLYRESYFDTDPNTGVTWLPGGINSAKPGYKIDS